MTGPDSEGLQAGSYSISEARRGDVVQLRDGHRAVCVDPADGGWWFGVSTDSNSRWFTSGQLHIGCPVLIEGADLPSPVVPSVGAVSVEVGSALARMLDKYLTTRGHTLSTAHLTGMTQLLAEADYVLGEARELREAMDALACAVEDDDPPCELQHLAWKVRAEIADVVLATTTLAGMMPGGATVEGCIAEKTEADRDRG